MPSAINTYGRIDINGNINSPKLTTSGLLMHLDAGNPLSYPGKPSQTGPTLAAWYDLSPNGNHFYLYNTPTHDPNTKSFNFNGIDEFALDATAFGYNINKDYIFHTYQNTSRYALYTDPYTTERTIEIWVKINNTLAQYYTNLFGWVLNLSGNLMYVGDGKYVWAWDDSLQSGVAQVNYTVQLGEWIQLVCLLKPYFQFGYYVNGQLDKDFQQTNTLATANPNNYWYLARDNRFGIHLACSVSIVRMYNRILTAQEIKNNYDNNKARFGLK